MWRELRAATLARLLILDKNVIRFVLMKVLHPKRDPLGLIRGNLFSTFLHPQSLVWPVDTNK